MTDDQIRLYVEARMAFPGRVRIQSIDHGRVYGVRASMLSVDKRTWYVQVRLTRDREIQDPAILRAVVGKLRHEFDRKVPHDAPPVEPGILWGLRR